MPNTTQTLDRTPFSWLQVENCGNGTALSQPFTLSSHTFSAFWLWSSVVSVLISVTRNMFPTGDLLACHINFCSGSVFLSLLRGLHVLLWHGAAATSATYSINVAYTQRFAKCSNHLKRTHSRISFYKKNKPLTHIEMKLTSSNCTSKLPVAFPLPVRVRRLENQVAFIAPWSNARSEC